MDNNLYQSWLDRHNISRPHKSGRWRVRWSDTLTINCLPDVIAVAEFESMNPTRTEWEYFCRWRDSEERKHKQNAAGFLRFAKYRHLVDGGGESQVRRTKKMCADIREAMTHFANGDFERGEAAMKDAWGAYMLLHVLSMNPLVLKGVRFQSGRKSGAKGWFRTMIEEEAKRIGNRDHKTVISSLENNDERIQEVDWESGEIWIKGDDDPRKIKTAQNILSQME